VKRGHRRLCWRVGQRSTHALSQSQGSSDVRAEVHTYCNLAPPRSSTKPPTQQTPNLHLSPAPISMSSGPPANQDELIASLASLTGVPPTEVRRRVESARSCVLTRLQAERYLAAGNWDIETAAALFFEQADPADDADSDADMADENTPQNPTPNPPPPQQQQQQQQQPGGGRTLDGTYVAPPPAASASSSSQPAARRQPQRGLRTMGDLQSSGGGGHGHGHDNSDGASGSDQDDENQDFFAGGEKSGLAVQNPNQSNPRDQINNILKRARQ